MIIEIPRFEQFLNEDNGNKRMDEISQSKRENKRTKNECQKSVHSKKKTPKNKRQRHERETLKSIRWYKNRNIVLKPKRDVERPKDLAREIPSSDKNNTYFTYFFS